MISLEILGWNPAFLRVFIDEIDHTFIEQKEKTKTPAKQTPKSGGNLVSTQCLFFVLFCFSLHAAIHLGDDNCMNSF